MKFKIIASSGKGGQNDRISECRIERIANKLRITNRRLNDSRPEYKIGRIERGFEYN